MRTMTKTTDTEGVATVAQAITAADREVPAYRRAVDFLREELEPRLTALRERRSALVAGRVRITAEEDLGTRAAALLQDAEILRPDPTAKDLEAVDDQIRVAEHAIRLQREIVNREHRAWFGVVCGELRHVHRGQVRAIAAALHSLSAALIQHARLANELDVAGVLFASDLRVMLLPNDSMRLDQTDSDARAWFKDARARDAGLIDG
jgi:hypothetical protein